MSKQWVLEWSKRQNAFHIQEAGRAIESNLQAMVSERVCDYITVMIGSREDCDKTADRFRHYLKKREPGRAGGSKSSSVEHCIN